MSDITHKKRYYRDLSLSKRAEIDSPFFQRAGDFIENLLSDSDPRFVHIPGEPVES